MPIQLLKTKLHLPPIRAALVPRPSLIERLNAGLHGKLTLVSAPAGSGKSTLVSTWLHDISRPATWLSLDEGDNDTARFFTYLIAALRQVSGEIGQAAERVLETSHPLQPESLVTMLINDIATVERFILVLDDYHVISEHAIQDAVAFLLERQPPQVHLVIITRHDPPLPLSRLRGRSQLTEIRQDDLHFSVEETAAFLNQAMGLGLAAAEITTLEQRTEGWITGLQLAALALQGRDEGSAARFVASFSGRHHFVLDYLADEVLENQPEPLKQFLLQTSILEQMCGPLCDAIVDTVDWRLEEAKAPGPSVLYRGQQTLHQLEAANLFVVPLDDERTWYRYHHLFADLLQARLQEAEPDGVPELHRRAAAWHEANGLPAEAVRHALATEDYGLAAGVIERAIRQVVTWSRLDVATLLGWLNALPGDAMRRRPWLRLFAARALFSGGQTESAEIILDELENSLRAEPSIPDAEQVLRLILADRGSYAVVRGDVQQAKEFTQHFLALVQEDDANSQIRGAAVLGMAYFRSGDVSRAGRAFTRAIHLAQAGNMPFAAVPLVCNLAEVQIAQGQLHLATQTLEQAMEMGTVDGTRTSITGFVGLELGKILYEQNDLQAAERHLADSLGLLSRGGIAESFGNMHALLALVKQAQGDAEAAEAAIELAVQAAQGGNIPRLSILASAYRARIRLAQGNVDLALQWAREYRQVGMTEYMREFEDLTLARVLLAADRPDEALALLDALLPLAETMGRWGRVIEIQALRALALQASGRQVQSLHTLESAFSQAEPEGFVRTFVDCGEPMRSLLRRAASDSIAPGYVARLLAVFDAPARGETKEPGAPSLPRPPGEQSLVEPLTNRELEVLHLLAEGLSNAEIGQRLFISLPTVKSHTRNIYGKLGVHSRKTAVIQARELGILPR